MLCSHEYYSLELCLYIIEIYVSNSSMHNSYQQQLQMDTQSVILFNEHAV
jgi:hypothetical protein